MARRQDNDFAEGRYLILIRDLCLTRPAYSSYEYRARRYDSTPGISECLKGTILQELLPTYPPSTGRLTCMILDTEELIECDEADVDPLTEEIMELLLAISNCKDRFDVFKNKDRLADGLDMQPDYDVTVRIQTSEVSGKLRYKGPLRNKLGTYFGVELINARGKGNSNGSVSKYRYFSCPEDCGVFLALNRVMSKEYDQLRTHTSTRKRNTYKSQRPIARPSVGLSSTNSSYRSNASSAHSSIGSSQQSVCEPIIGVTEEELNSLDIHIGMQVYIFTEVNGRESQELGTVRFIGRLPNELPTRDIYVGIDLVKPVGNGRGVFNKRHLFKTKPNHAALVPLSGVLPASTLDVTPALVPNGTQYTRVSTNEARSRESRRPATQGQLGPGRELRNPGRQRNSFEPSLLGDDEGYLKPVEINYNLKHSQRGLPDGAMTDLDTELSSQIDIYGGASHKYPSNDHDRRMGPSPIYPPGIMKPDQPTRLQRPQLSGSGYDNIADLEVGSMVLVTEGTENIGDIGILGPIHGVIKWIGVIPRMGSMMMAGIELEAPIPGLNNGVIDGVRYFECLPERGMFIALKFCEKDPRFITITDNTKSRTNEMKPSSHNFGDFDATGLPGRIAPPTKLSNSMVGKGKGIQGHHNSCYLDSTLFSLFAYSYCLDSILFREKNPSDLPQYQQVQRVLKEDIVNPLRRRNFVRADRIMMLRELLDELGSVTGLTNEEKDPEEFLQTLLNHVFKAEPLFELRQGDSDHIQECYFYQIFLDKDEKMVLPSTQSLIEQSFLASDLKFREVPVCLILQMPRFGKDYKMYNRVRPSLKLDVTDMIEKLPRSCTVCGGLAEYECKQCSIERSMQEHISSYCDQCARICHQHPMRRQHSYKKIDVCDEYRTFIAQEGEMPVERHVLDLYAVVCIETSHYVSFAKCGYGRHAKWCFFDSMADRVGEQSGYNIPEVTYCEDFQTWLEMDQSKLLEMDQKAMPDRMRRLLCDAYMCLYQSQEMMCYM